MHSSSKKRRAGGSGRGANITVNPPSEPKFIREMRTQIALDEANQQEERQRERAKRVKGAGLTDDGFTVVKLTDDDLTEEEYNRMKLELETQYRLQDTEQADNSKPVKFEIDSLMQGGSTKKKTETTRESEPKSVLKAKPKKKLIGLEDDSSSEED